ncbi:MAG: flagellar biosynthesis protein [Idiomarina sp. T82-3]|jgi:flagellar protein FliO/FliZ|nr:MULTISPECIES: flagellar biosynthetic protein FliO [unclassified Idiomarina]KXS34136.1 MAG: flagellar biosynthesis protein [Idiomarina sp. T82-3]|tara:strand:+ start:258 stop:620 length:363 start_codon:yes stop_codon:yes gene_type:complete
MLSVKSSVFVSCASIWASPALAQVEKATSPIGGKDIASMLVALIAVIVVIIALATVLKRFNVKFQGSKGMKLMGTLSLGPKERISVVQIGDKKFLLGVTPERVECLKELPDDFVLGEEKQ